MNINILQSLIENNNNINDFTKTKNNLLCSTMQRKIAQSAQVIDNQTPLGN